MPPSAASGRRRRAPCRARCSKLPIFAPEERDDAGCAASARPGGRARRSTAARSGCPEGTTILQACATVGIETPTLCYLETLDAGERLPRLRRRGRGVAGAGAGLLAPGRARHGRPDRHARVRHSRRLVLRAARLVGRSVAGVGGDPRTHKRVRGASGAVWRSRRGGGTGERDRAKPAITRHRRSNSRDRRAADQDRQRPLRARLLALHPLLQMRRGVRRGRPEHLRDCRRRPRVRRARSRPSPTGRFPTPRASTAATASASARPAR